MNAYRQDASDAKRNTEVGYDYAAAVNQRPSKWVALALWLSFTGLAIRAFQVFGFDHELSLPIAALAGFTIAWPVWAKMTSNAGSVVTLYERQLEEKMARAASRKARPRRRS